LEARFASPSKVAGYTGVLTTAEGRKLLCWQSHPKSANCAPGIWREAVPVKQTTLEAWCGGPGPGCWRNFSGHHCSATVFALGWGSWLRDKYGYA
jgi:hypothetical protein